MRDTAPKIVSFEIPVDKIGEVIGPKGKVINTIQQETGADISVQDADGMSASCRSARRTAPRSTRPQRRIELILDPPTAEVGAIYDGRVVNITKFGAFVNILPGRDGLIHISKLGQRQAHRPGRRRAVARRRARACSVDDIDQNGKLSLSLVGDDADGGGDGRPSVGGDRAERAERPERCRATASRARARDGRPAPAGGARPRRSRRSGTSEAREEFGDLGPAEEPAGAGGGRGGDRGGRAAAAGAAAVAVAARGGGPRR